MYPVEDKSAATLLPIIADSFLPGSNVHSDLWRAYNGVGFQHFTLNRSLNFVLDWYFCEYMWRQCHKNDDLFEQVLADIAVFWPPV